MTVSHEIDNCLTLASYGCKASFDFIKDSLNSAVAGNKTSTHTTQHELLLEIAIDFDEGSCVINFEKCENF